MQTVVNDKLLGLAEQIDFMRGCEARRYARAGLIPAEAWLAEAQFNGIHCRRQLRTPPLFPDCETLANYMRPFEEVTS